jgi:predicted lipoprotein with Yx(FWY)xxD motif
MMKVFAGFLILASLAPTVSMAQTVGPADIGMTHGALSVGDQALFVSDQPADTPCSRPCSATPFLAAPDAIEGGLWTLAPTSGGRQWLYDGAPLFVWGEIGADFGRFFFRL